MTAQSDQSSNARPGTGESCERAVATFRFHAELNDFLAREQRHREIVYRCARAATVKNAIEALGVPHTEVDVILVNGELVDLSRPVRDGDRVAVYPREGVDVHSLRRSRDLPLPDARFVADAHLGGLARLLRMLGFDTVFANDIPDEHIAALAAEDGRVVLTRDRELLKRRGIVRGCYLHALRPQDQLREVVQRFGLAAYARPFTRCLHCNLPLHAIEKRGIVDRLPPKVAALHERFQTCDGCRRIFWEGSHWTRMREMLATLLHRRPCAGDDQFSPP